jgi:type IV pilus assembly protein PilW
MNRWRGFNLVELLIAQVIGLALLVAFLIVLQRGQRDFAISESLARLQDAARHALGLLAADLEHAGFFGYSTGARFRLVSRGATLADQPALLQPGAGRSISAVAGLPAGAHDCGINFAVDLERVIQGSDNHFRIGHEAGDCAPTASAGGARNGADTLTVRHASLAVSAPRAGRLQVYSAALAAAQPLLLFSDGHAPGPVDDGHEVRDLEIHTYYIANHSVDRRGWPALRVKSLTESRGAVQFRDEEVMPGVEDLQVEFGVAAIENGEQVVRFVAPDAPRASTGHIIAVRLWLRLRADSTEPGHLDERTLEYANVSFTPDGLEARQRRLLIERTVALRNLRAA